MNSVDKVKKEFIHNKVAINEIKRDFSAELFTGEISRKPTLKLVTAKDPLKRLINMLKKDFSQRSTNEVRETLVPMIEDIDFFKELKLGQVEMMTLCKNLKYEFYPRGSCIFRKGDDGDKMYFILKGRIALSFPLHKSVGASFIKQGLTRANVHEIKKQEHLHSKSKECND